MKVKRITCNVTYYGGVIRNELYYVHSNGSSNANGNATELNLVLKKSVS